MQGYENLFKKLLANPLIAVHLNEEYKLPAGGLPDGTKVIFTGMPDRLFGYKYGALGWRSLRFEWRSLPMQDFQGIGQMNYADREIPFTRIHEYKHYHPERREIFNSAATMLCLEYPASYVAGDEAYYPVNDAVNNDRYQKYADDAARHKGLILGGRLGSYKYWNMDITVANALKTFNELILPNA